MTKHKRGAVRVKALESLLIEKGYLTREGVDFFMTLMEREWTWWPGAHLIAQAWTDPAFRQRFVDEPDATIYRLTGISDAGPGSFRVVENTASVHNVIVCSLCSCYPMTVLGFPPEWYKSPAYRGRMTREPRAALRDLGCEIPDGVEIRVWDSSAEQRYIVLPIQPGGTEGMAAEELAGRVTREMVIGVAR